MVLPMLDSAGRQITTIVRNANFSRENDNTMASRRVALNADYILDHGTRVVPFSARQLLPFAGAIGSAPLTGQLRMTADLGGTFLFAGGGDMTDTNQMWLTTTRPNGTSNTAQRQWSRDTQGYYWWEPAPNQSNSSSGYTFSQIHLPQLAVRATVPGPSAGAGSLPVLGNSAAMTVYLTDRATQSSVAGIRAVRIDAAQPDVPVSVEWNHAMLVLRPTATLAPGLYEFVSAQALQSEAGSPPAMMGQYLRVRFEVR
jgi:hypothetical protein